MTGDAKDYDKAAIIAVILPRYAEGESLRSICRSDTTLPAESTIRLWAILDEPAGFAAQYTRARQLHADALIEEAQEIADDGSRDTITKTRKDGSEFEAPDHEWINRSRLRVDTRKWAAAKLHPNRYGDKVDVTSGGEKVENPQVWQFGNRTIEFK